jgi:hypothetical protein
MYKTIPKRANKIKTVQSKSSHNAWFLNLRCQVSYQFGPVIDETQLGQWVESHGMVRLHEADVEHREYR